MRSGAFRNRRVNANKLSSSYKVFTISSFSSSSLYHETVAKIKPPKKKKPTRAIGELLAGTRPAINIFIYLFLSERDTTEINRIFQVWSE